MIARGQASESQPVRTLVAPFIELAFLTALVFAGVVISRSRFFDHWEWSFLHYLLFTFIDADNQDRFAA